MNDERSLWRKLLHIEEPWTVLDSRVDAARRRHDVTIGVEVPRGWFGLGRRAPASAQSASWRHVNFGAWEIHLRVAAPVDVDLARLPWAGDPDLPFTHTLSQHVFALLRVGCSLQAICELLSLPIGELWRFRYAIDQGRWTGAEAAAPKAGGAAKAPAESAAGPAGGDGADVPDVSDPVWFALLDGSRQLDVRVLALKLLLTRLRSQFEVISDDDVRLLKRQEFHRYFIKNKHLLAHELAQLRKA